MMGSQSYRDLLVWQKSIELCVQVYKACEAFPKSELYGLSDQMKRAAVSISSNIAEGQGRQHVKEFLHFISIANGSCAELDTQRIIAERLQFLSLENSLHFDQRITEIRKMLYALTTKLKVNN
ncbi:MAG TPA: four helix bundle protein [Pyrinomonadaceae bacterium]|jgi:four helix bundle protein